MKNVSSGKTRGSRPHHRRKKKKKSSVKFLKRKRKKRNTKGILKILKEKKTESEQSQDKVEPITSPMSDWSWKSEEENSN